MNVEGRVLIDLPTAAGLPVKVEYSRPGNITDLFRGRAPEDVVRLVPAVYSVCATAQAHASVVALEQATGLCVSPMTVAARKALTGMETLREHLLRIALDWPVFVGEQPRGARVRQVMSLVAQLTRALFGADAGLYLGREAKPDREAAEAIIDTAQALLIDEVFTEPLEHWLARTNRGDIAAWAEKGGTVAQRFIRRVAEAGWSGVGDTPAIDVPKPPVNTVRDWLADSEQECEALPQLELSDIPETTLFSRRERDAIMTPFDGGGLGPRQIARLVELARLPGELRSLIEEYDDRCEPVQDADGFGWSAIDAARGLLIHAVELRRGVINDYRILPPTRWNFDAEGVAKRCLTEIGEADTDKRLQQANLIVNAIDPCVAHEVRVH